MIGERILIVNVNWLGDTLFVTPFIRAIREGRPRSYIAVLTHPRCFSILEGNPHINEIIIYDERKKHKGLLGKFSIISHLRSMKFDTAFILRPSLSRSMILFLSKIRSRIGYKSKRSSFLLTKKINTTFKDMHKVEYFLNIARAIGIEPKSKNYEIFISGADNENSNRILMEAGIKDEGFIALNPGGNWDLKRWPFEHFARLGDEIYAKLNRKVAITGADSDIELAKKISDLMTHKPVILCGKSDLKTLAGILKKAQCVISNDSGPMHVAVAMKTSVVALFGPTSPKITGPYGDGVKRILQKDVKCKIPCYELSCEDNKCMKAISVEEVFEAVKKLVGDKG